MFSVNITRWEFKDATVICDFGFAFEKEKTGREKHIIARSWFQEADPFSKCVLEKLRSRDGLVWTVGLFVEIKLRFQYFRGMDAPPE